MVTIHPSNNCIDYTPEERLEDYAVVFATGGMIRKLIPSFRVYCYAEAETESTTLFEVTLHPDGNTVRVVADLTLNKNSKEIQGICFYMDFYGDELPNLILKGKSINRKLFRQILTGYIDHNEFIAFEYQEARRFEKRPDLRILKMMEASFELYDGLQPFGLVALPPYRWGENEETTHLSSSERADCIRLLMREDNLIKEMKTLVMAYTGSAIQLDPSRGDQLRFQTFWKLFLHFIRKCNFDPDRLRQHDRRQPPHVFWKSA